MRFLIFVLITFSFAHAQTGPAELKQRAEEITARLIQTHLPELTAYKITIDIGDSKQSVVKTSYAFRDLVSGPRHRNYRIVLSKAYQANFPSWSSLESVLLHELYHVLDYTRMSASELRKFTFKLNVTRGKFVPRYERCTDFRAIQKNYVESMLEYREWQQANMAPHWARKKLRNYFTPTELRDGSWRSFQDCPPEAVLE